MSTAKADSASTQTFITSLTTNFIIAGVELAGFLIARPLLKGVYEPRTYVPPKEDQAPVLSKNPFAPIWNVIKADPTEILHKSGVDPYVFLRFLRMMTRTLIPIWVVSWAVLLPVDSVGAPIKRGLEMFTFGNVSQNEHTMIRLWAHCVLTWLFNLWMMFNMWREMKHWLDVRQRYLVSPGHSKRPQANTVLITGIPHHLMDEGKLEQLFSYLPGGVKRIWLTRNLKEMPEVYERRLKACNVLENAQVKLIQKANKLHLQAEEKIHKLESKGKPVPDELRRVASGPSGHGDPQGGEGNGHENASLAERLVPRKDRPQIRLKPSWSPISLGFLCIGEKVDQIDWARKEIAETNAELTTLREQLARDIDSFGAQADQYPPLASAFIQFNQQIAAHMARQCVSYSQPYRMNRRFIEQSPKNVIWRNMSLTSYETNLRQLGSFAATIGLIIGYIPLAAFFTNMTTIVKLASAPDTSYGAFKWILGDSFGKHLLQGVVQGILPPVLLAVVLLIVPIILRQLATLQGLVSKTEIELDLMTRYFVFLLTVTMIVPTIAGSLAQVVQMIQSLANDPTSKITEILTQNLPAVSTFFITRILLKFTGTMGVILQPITLIIYYSQVVLGSGTPRGFFKSRYRMPVIDYGSEFPGITVAAVVMLTYMIISPIINGLGAAFFAVSYFCYKYVFIWVIDQPRATDTGGLFFPKAITHVFVGLYVQEVALAFLFLTAGGSRAAPQGGLIIVLVFVTAACQYVLRTAYKPLLNALPLSLAHLSYGMPQSENDAGNIDKQEAEDQDDGATSKESNRLSMAEDPLIAGAVPMSSQPRALPKAAEAADVRWDPNTQQWSSGVQQSPTTPKSAEWGPQRPAMMKRGSSRASLSVVPHTTAHDDDDDDDDDHDETEEFNDDHEEDYKDERIEMNDLSKARTWSTDRKASHSDRKLSFSDSKMHSRRKSDKSDRKNSYSGRRGSYSDRFVADGEGKMGDFEAQDDEANKYFAVPGGKGVREDRSGDYDDPAAFFPPASKDPQPVIWLPRDSLGLGVAEVAANRAAGVRSTTRNALLTHAGKIQITGPAPENYRRLPQEKTSAQRHNALAVPPTLG